MAVAPPAPVAGAAAAPPVVERRLSLAALRQRYVEALEALRECRLCPRRCGADRLAGERGFCRAGALARVASTGIHHGEEPPISGTGGSGTVFFSHCNMACLFCQNYPISQLGVGKEMTAAALGALLLGLQRKGAHNVNFVTPTPHIPQLVGAVLAARERGFSLPVVANTNGYDSPEGLSLLDGLVDIYLPDIKYRSGMLASRVSATPDYPLHNAPAAAEMLRQVGPLEAGKDGIAVRGVLIRHLLLPGRLGETERVLAFIRDAFGPETPLSLMGQYFPAWRAPATRGFDRKPTEGEYGRAIAAAERLGLENVYVQEMECPGEPT